MSPRGNLAEVTAKYKARRKAISKAAITLMFTGRRRRALVLAWLAVLVVGRADAIEVAVDVGHTLTAPGAVSARGGAEFDFNRILAARVVSALSERGLGVRPINFDGRIESLEARPRQALGSDLFFSIHHDSVQEKWLEEWEWEGAKHTHSDRYIGFSLFVSRANPDLATSLRCASAVGARLRRLGFVAATHHADSLASRLRPYADVDNAVHYYDNLVVLYRTSMPAVLFEAGIMKHRAEEMALRDPALQIRMADAVATGIAACLHVRRAPSAGFSSISPVYADVEIDELSAFMNESSALPLP